MPPPVPIISTINNTPDETQKSVCKEIENQSNRIPETKLPVCEPDNSTDIMEPNKTTTRSTTNKIKELEKASTPLVQ